MTDGKSADLAAKSILIVDGDIISRHAIAAYLRDCAFAVVEAANIDEAKIALGEASLNIDAILCEFSALGSQNGFKLANWVCINRPELEVKLAGGLEKAAEAAGQLCESGPRLARPYEPDAVVAYVTRSRATRLS